MILIEMPVATKRVAETSHAYILCVRRFSF